MPQRPAAPDSGLLLKRAAYSLPSLREWMLAELCALAAACVLAEVWVLPMVSALASACPREMSVSSTCD